MDCTLHVKSSIGPFDNSHLQYCGVCLLKYNAKGQFVCVCVCVLVDILNLHTINIPSYHKVILQQI